MAKLAKQIIDAVEKSLLKEDTFDLEDSLRKQLEPYGVPQDVIFNIADGILQVTEEMSDRVKENLISEFIESHYEVSGKVDESIHDTKWKVKRWLMENPNYLPEPEQEEVQLEEVADIFHQQEEDIDKALGGFFEALEEKLDKLPKSDMWG